MDDGPCKAKAEAKRGGSGSALSRNQRVMMAVFFSVDARMAAPGLWEGEGKTVGGGLCYAVRLTRKTGRASSSFDSVIVITITLVVYDCLSVCVCSLFLSILGRLSSYSDSLMS